MFQLWWITPKRVRSICRHYKRIVYLEELINARKDLSQEKQHLGYLPKQKSETALLEQGLQKKSVQFGRQVFLNAFNIVKPLSFEASFHRRK